jgi:DNA helicase II / ATP-dependent DNA helicase PcrA
MDTSGPDKKAKINFSGVGEKTLLLSFAKLRIVQ